MTISSGTSSPESMNFFASRPSGWLTRIASRSMSPVEICGMPYFSVMNCACVPLPAPGKPKRIIFIVVSTWFGNAPCASPGRGREAIVMAFVAARNRECQRATPGRAPSGGVDQAPYPVQVVLRVHTSVRSIGGHQHADAQAMPQHAQLFERLPLFQRRGSEPRVTAQESRAIGVD